MKMYKLRDIVQDYAYNLKESAAYSGSWEMVDVNR